MILQPHSTCPPPHPPTANIMRQAVLRGLPLQAIPHKRSAATKLCDRSHKKLSSITELYRRFYTVEISLDQNCYLHHSMHCQNLVTVKGAQTTNCVRSRACMLFFLLKLVRTHCHTHPSHCRHQVTVHCQAVNNKIMCIFGFRNNTQYS